MKENLKALDTDTLMRRYAETKDKEIRNELVVRYLYISEIVAKKFANRGVDYDDLYQVAAMALIKAIERFDANKGFKFSSFAKDRRLDISFINRYTFR